MILTCPACQTRYLIDDQELGGAEGRAVRCANCGHTWHQHPPPPELRRVLSVDVAPPEPPLDVPPRPGGQRLPSPRRQSWAGAFWLALIVLLLAAILTGIYARQQVVAIWPAAARFYALAGLATAKPGAGLSIRNIIARRSADGFVITGEIVNTSKDATDVPQLQATLRDTKKNPLQSKIVTLPKSRLLPGEIEHFTVSFEHSPDAATGVAVEFAAP